jgi:hypothetical protein
MKYITQEPDLIMSTSLLSYGGENSTQVPSCQLEFCPQTSLDICGLSVVTDEAKCFMPFAPDIIVEEVKRVIADHGPILKLFVSTLLKYINN